MTGPDPATLTATDIDVYCRVVRRAPAEFQAAWRAACAAFSADPTHREELDAALERVERIRRDLDDVTAGRRLPAPYDVSVPEERVLLDALAVQLRRFIRDRELRLLNASLEESPS